jgi:hypothetical protein
MLIQTFLLVICSLALISTAIAAAAQEDENLVKIKYSKLNFYEDTPIIFPDEFINFGKDK